MRRVHPAANLMPPMPDGEFQELVEDIKQNGLIAPIELLDGEVIDGRHRMKACLAAGVEPDFVEIELTDWMTPEQYVWSLNGLRRHLTTTQRHCIALELSASYAEQAKERQLSTLKQNATVPAKSQERKGEAVEQAASAVGVGARGVYEAKAIREESPDLFEQMKSGEITTQEAKRQLKPHVSNNSGNNEWNTPVEIIEAARKAMGSIDLDPASNDVAQSNVKAKLYYTANDDGLSKKWRGRVWLNPPYEASLVGPFIEKLIEHLKSGDVKQAVTITNNATETRWGQSLLDNATVVCFPTGRVRFLDSENNASKTPLQGQMVCYFGSSEDDFCEAFEQFGPILGGHQ